MSSALYAQFPANHIQDATLTKFAGYNEEEITPVFDLLINYLEAPVAHEALFKKYASKKFLKGMTHHEMLSFCGGLTSNSIHLGQKVG